MNLPHFTKCFLQAKLPLSIVRVDPITLSVLKVVLRDFSDQQKQKLFLTRKYIFQARCLFHPHSLA